MSRPLEALLRPAVELYPALAALLMATVALVAPWALLMPPTVAYATAGVLILFALVRGRQAWRVLRYQRNMRRLPRYIVRAEQIPDSKKRLFLGQGFRWRQQHTQRLRDTYRPEAQPYIQPSAFYEWVREKEIAWEKTPALNRLITLFSQTAWWNPASPLPPVGGSPQLHGVEHNEKPVWLDILERAGHMLVLGTTRVGKTRLAELLVAQDIRRGEVTIVIDPKGDADLMRRVIAEARRAGREDELYIFHLGYPDISARYNPIGNFSRTTEVATRIANQLPGEGSSSAFKEFSWRFVNIIGQALVALGRRPDYTQIVRHITSIDALLQDYCRTWLPANAPEGWAEELALRAGKVNDKNVSFAMRGRAPELVALVEYLKDKDLHDPVVDGLRSAVEYDKTYFDKIVASLLPLMEKLVSGRTAELISPDYLDVNDKRPIFDWMQVIRRRGIVYIGLDALSDATVSAAVGNSMFADLVSIAGQIYKHGNHQGLPGENTNGANICIHADEFNELIGDEFVPLLNKAGGAGYRVTAYTQTWSDVEAKIGNAAKAGQIGGNFNSVVMMRVREDRTAELLTSQLPDVDVTTLMQVSGVNDTASPGDEAHFTSKNEDRISVEKAPLLNIADIISLPKGQAFALLNGGQLWKLRIPLADDSDDEHMPADIAAVAADMEARYSTDTPLQDDNTWIGQPVDLSAEGNG